MSALSKHVPRLIRTHMNASHHHLTFPMASVWCCVQICSLLTQCCLSLASVAVKKEKNNNKKQVSETLSHSLRDDLTQHRFPYASASPAADNGKHPDQYCMNLMDGDGSRPRAEKQREGVEKPASVLGHLPLSLYCSPLMALTVKVCESSSLGEMTAPARGSIPRGFWGRDCSLTKYSRKPASLFKTKNLQGTTA